MPEEVVSIIIPVYNAEKTLERAVRSARDQTWEKTEILLVDDGSADGSAELARRLAEEDSRIRALTLGETRGVSAARNLGLQRAAGDLVTFLDADDAMEPSLVDKLLELHRKTGAAICGCGFRSVEQGAAVPVAGQTCRRAEEAEEHAVPEESGETVGSEPATGTAATGTAGRASVWPQIHTGSEIIRDCFLRQGDTRVWSKLFTRDILQGHFFDEDLTIGEDALFVLSLIGEATRYASIEEPLYLYTVNPSGAMERPFVPSYMDQLRCWDKAEELISHVFPEVLGDRENGARFAALRLVSAVLTASKIARLPAGTQEQYQDQFAQCRRTAAAAASVPGAGRFLPKGYGLKNFLLVHCPGIYRRLYSRG